MRLVCVLHVKTGQGYIILQNVDCMAHNSHHSIAPNAAGLFHGAILQSGVGIAPWSVMLEKFNASDYVYQVANSVGCDTSSTDVMVACLRTVDAQVLADSDSIVCTVGVICDVVPPCGQSRISWIKHSIITTEAAEIAVISRKIDAFSTSGHKCAELSFVRVQ